MDTVAVRQQVMDILKKYRYAVIVLLVGLVFMALPEKQEAPKQTEPIPELHSADLQQELAEILSRIQGAGRVEVLLTEFSGPETIYQTNLDQSDSEIRRDTVILSNSSREEEGLVRQVNPPIYQGALVVCQGADSPAVKLAIVQAVMSVTGLTSNQITVLKMK